MNLSIEISIFSSRLSSICEEMGAALKRAAFSPNIKDRLDYSCAVFDAQGLLCAQAAHIPVHLGSMAFAMKDLVSARDWQQGDIVVLNDPYLGGTHLPDVTVIAPVFVGRNLAAFVANRAHHANIGASQPGSMPIASRLEEEGNVIPPSLLVENNKVNEAVLQSLAGSDDPRIRGDFLAQISASQLGRERLRALIEKTGPDAFNERLQALNEYAESLALQEWKSIPNGRYSFEDTMDDDGLGNRDIVIKACVIVQNGRVSVDFKGTAEQAAGNINCPLSVTAAAVYYAFRCLLPDFAPACAGTFAPISLCAETGLLVNAQRPAAVAAGNVETSSRIVDVIFGALSKALPDLIPAASQGSMNNVAMGSLAQPGQSAWDYYETLGGGGGAGPAGQGASGMQTHMTNTLNTPVESIESHFPLRILRYQQRQGSGGAGQFNGGDGVLREYQFLADAKVSLLTERRSHSPWGLHGAEPGKPGQNRINKSPLAGKCILDVKAGDSLIVETPGGGGWNSPRKTR